MTLFILIIVAFLIYYFFIYKTDGFSILGFNKGKKCPNCHNPVEENFNVCPVCKETLKRKCTNCGERLDALWKYCPYCEKPAGGSGEQ